MSSDIFRQIEQYILRYTIFTKDSKEGEGCYTAKAHDCIFKFAVLLKRGIVSATNYPVKYTDIEEVENNDDCYEYAEDEDLYKEKILMSLESFIAWYYMRFGHVDLLFKKV